ncbi:MAG: monofunctional biosynthetic peptidoglycan transglycosylase [Desulfobacterales bacterium]|nr:monofunctional biosynthetic peptidoglycan transglycosylase [Desulfobacterales bacterium]
MKTAFKIIGIAILLVVVLGGFYFFLGLPDVSELKIKNPRSTALMVQRYREAKKVDATFRIRQKWIELKEIPKLLQETVRVTEDASFYQHKGIDFSELKEAIKKNWQKGEYVRGASTITQQLAKNLYLSTDKSIIRKIKELLITLRLEKDLSKDRIFELYLNVIEWGPGIFGVEMASEHYFNKAVGQLSLEEIVRLVAVIPRPLDTNPTENSDWLKWKARWILDALRRYAYIDQNQYQSIYDRFH